MAGAAQAQAPDPSVCDRTPQVRDAIVAWFEEDEGISDCSEVTVEHLERFGRRERYDRDGSQYYEWFPFILGSNITELQKGDFANMASLQELEIVRSPITTLPDSVFTGLEGLWKLSILYNLFTTLPSRVFAGLEYLENLNILNTPLTTLPDSIFAGFKNLRRLDMSGNEFTTLPADVFADLKMLKSLWLDRNSLETLPVGVFKNLETLSLLSLYENKFETLPEGIFTGLENLKELSLKGNPGFPFTLPLEVIRTDDNASIFDSAKVAIRIATGIPYEGQVTLSLTGGEASSETISLEPGAVVSAPVKITRHADNTGAVFVAVSPIPYNTHRYDIELRADSLFLFPEAIIPNPAVCDRTPQVRDAIVERLKDVAECSEVTGEDLLSLKSSIFLSDIRMDALKQGDFSGLDSLEILHLNDNEFTTLPDRAFSGLDSLKILYLHNNELSTVAPHTFAGLKNLRVLRLYNNNIEALPEGIFSGLRKLTTLWIHKNQLTTLPDNMFADLASLTNLSLRDNPGAPFEFMLEVIRTDDGAGPAGRAKVAARMFPGMPIWGKPGLSLSAEGGAVKPEMVTFEPGAMVSSPAIATRDADNGGTVKISITQVDTGPVALGVLFVRNPLVLFGEASGPTSTETGEELPEEVSLSANYPNPFNPETTIRYALPVATTLRLAVYDMLGREVGILADGPQAAGRHALRFHAGPLPSGTYIIRLDADGESIVRTMTLSR